jgi:uncharacterized protein YjbI with pentapeptide repeats
VEEKDFSDAFIGSADLSDALVAQTGFTRANLAGANLKAQES